MTTPEQANEPDEQAKLNAEIEAAKQYIRELLAQGSAKA